ncbi:flagellar hook protein FlgE [Rhizorhabdus dicambivorans]|uniref:Flagellar hook protein FlgE n=1 Tax=Rhizorhabdus dicambivorans TaxID=1850238 RepID=A0A2A4FSN3_9SPHN|nr:flagellar hook protein FlgE [Rhizorhabdus dicambivorans]ATE64452.1 flagellar hook protein FlgE [Rhizorhabdus dicambivorans]PCE41197.1 flagellar hook protein FlgE [Rhizorhabdus dicambivorans]
MSFYTSLSGLKASQTDLAVISNNIANVGTTAFKRSDTEFSDLVSSSPLQSAGIAGQGTRLRGIAQQFTQGGLEASERSLDLAISGQGFFMTRASSSNAQVSYTRNGAFSVDANRFLVDSAGAYLQVLPTDSSGTVTATGISATRSVQLPLTSGTSQATQNINLAVTFPSAADVPSTRSVYTATNPYAFDRNDANSYNQSTTTTVYDASGTAFPMTTYYTRENIPSGATTTTSWTAHTFIGDTEISYDNSAATQPAPLTLTFDASGAMTAPSSAMTIGPVAPNGASAPLTFDLSYGASTKQSSAPFTLTSFDQDGFAAGALDNVSVGSDGLVVATFSNGDSQALGKIIVATFANPEGLRQLGDSKWGATGVSGEPIINEANSNGTGQIQSGALEQANVDITEELVALIQAQRNFSANAKAIEAANTMTQTIVQLRT